MGPDCRVVNCQGDICPEDIFGQLGPSFKSKSKVWTKAEL